MSSHKHVGAAALCLLAVASLLFVSTSTPGSLSATSDTSQVTGDHHSPRAEYVGARGDVLLWDDARGIGQDVRGQEGLEPVAYLPLVLKGYPAPPAWSGTARFGFGVVKNPVEEYDVSLLHADWYLRFGFDSDPPLSLGLEFAQIIRLSESGYSPGQTAIEAYAIAHPGALWLVGNEPDSPWQDCVVPSRYAELYHELYYIIKGADPTAQVAIGGVVQATDLRLQYLDEILEAYQAEYDEMIPVDVWNVHGFVLNEEDGEWGAWIPCGISAQQGMLIDIDDHDNMYIFRRQIRRFRQWMSDQGERDKPLVVSEYGILMNAELGFDEARVESFMLATFDYFLSATSSDTGYPDDGNRLVQAWNWYSLDDHAFEGEESYGHLFDPDTKEITALGEAYGDYAASVP